MPTWVRVVALVALAAAALAAIRRQPLRVGEQAALAWLTIVVGAIVVGVIAWATLADGR